MKITINQQILTGNFPDGFNLEKWISAIETKYRAVANQWFPNAEIVVSHDMQRASGYTRPLSVDFDDDNDASAVDQQSMVAQIESIELDEQDFYD